MLIFRIALWVVLLVGVIILITQIIIPGLRGRPLFPLFNPRRQAADAQLAKAREEYEVAVLKRTANEADARTKAIEKGTDSNPNKE